MPITNNNIPGIDVPQWEQLPSALANSAAGSSTCNDGKRYIYYLISATSFWRYDTRAHTYQQLASPPAGTVAAGSCLRYLNQIGAQRNGIVYGSVYAFQASGTAVTFYRYNIADNTWTSALSVTNVPAAWVIDGRLICPEPAINAYQGGYHNAQALNVITATANAIVGATSITVSALPLALPANAVLNFGTAASPVWACLTAAAAAGATSLAVSALVAQVNSAAVAYFYADMFLFGNNAQLIYRYNFAANAWYTTSANTGNPALVAVGAAMAAGCVAAWLPGSGEANALDRIILVCGGVTSVIREYSLTGNTVAALTYYPSNETFTTGTGSAIRDDPVTGKAKSLILQKDTQMRFFDFNRAAATMTPLVSNAPVTSGTALVGDRTNLIAYSGIEFVYHIPSASSFLVRTPLFFRD